MRYFAVAVLLIAATPAMLDETFLAICAFVMWAFGGESDG